MIETNVAKRLLENHEVTPSKAKPRTRDLTAKEDTSLKAFISDLTYLKNTFFQVLFRNSQSFSNPPKFGFVNESINHIRVIVEFEFTQTDINLLAYIKEKIPKACDPDRALLANFTTHNGLNCIDNITCVYDDIEATGGRLSLLLDINKSSYDCYFRAGVVFDERYSSIYDTLPYINKKLIDIVAIYITNEKNSFMAAKLLTAPSCTEQLDPRKFRSLLGLHERATMKVLSDSKLATKIGYDNFVRYALGKEHNLPFTLVAKEILTNKNILPRCSYSMIALLAQKYCLNDDDLFYNFFRTINAALFENYNEIWFTALVESLIVPQHEMPNAILELKKADLTNDKIANQVFADKFLTAILEDKVLIKRISNKSSVFLMGIAKYITVNGLDKVTSSTSIIDIMFDKFGIICAFDSREMAEACLKKAKEMNNLSGYRRAALDKILENIQTRTRSGRLRC